MKYLVPIILAFFLSGCPSAEIPDNDKNYEYAIIKKGGSASDLNTTLQQMYRDGWSAHEEKGYTIVLKRRVKQ